MKTLKWTLLLVAALGLNAQAANVKKPAARRPASSSVAGVPRLNIPMEQALQSNIKPLEVPAAPESAVKPLARRQSPTDLQLPTGFTTVQPAQSAKVFTNEKAVQKIPDVKVLPDVQDPNLEVSDAQPALQPINDMKPNDYKMLQALIFLDYQKNYELALGLFAELMQDPAYRTEAWYNYALTAKGLNLNSEFRMGMIKVAEESKSKEWQEKAVHKLIENIALLKISDIKHIDPLVTKYDIDTTQNEAYQMARAKYYLDAGQLDQVEDALVFIGEKSPLYPEALMVSALSNYRQGKVDDAIIVLNKLEDMTSGDKKGLLHNVGALTLGRMYFQKGAYKDAFQAYLNVDKSSGMWLQAMTEQAWTQILAEDYEGAAGNMFSLHTDFFKNAFAPESYTVRTVGYLNLCQYGDGMQVLNEMKKKYGTLKARIQTYQNANDKHVMAYYDTVKSWMKNTDRKEVDGLPRAFIVELARHPSFTVVQSDINTYEDEIARFNKVTMTMLDREKTMLKKTNEVAQQVSALRKKKIDKKNSDLDEQIAKEERRLMSYKIQLFIAQKSRNSIKKLREMGIARMEKEKGEFREAAAGALKGRMAQLSTNLNRVLEQNEVLAYELYSGAGEHIRYQMAGGEITNKERPELKVEAEKSLQWKFQGEIWEDEVGHYRSSLKNVCPKESSITQLDQQ